MITMQIITLLLFPLLITTSNTGSVQYAFYRSMNASRFDGTRRIFGGDPVELSEYSAVCALVDPNKIVKCTGAIVTKFWVLTAAHCVTPKVAFVKYNSRWSNDVQSKSSPVIYMYRHPEVIEEDEGYGMDVTLLHHDIGMVRTQYAMILSSLPKADPFINMKRFNPIDLKKEEVTILGFGRKDQDGAPDSRGEALFSVTLQLTFCERGSWFHCMCGMASPVARSQGGGGVCTGDSGGPVLYRGSQIALTSMGPIQCRKLFNSGTQGATSVFTTLYQYANVINSTITKTENMLHERKPRTQHDPVKEKCDSSKIHYILFWLSILLCILSNRMKYL